MFQPGLLAASSRYRGLLDELCDSCRLLKHGDMAGWQGNCSSVDLLCHLLFERRGDRFVLSGDDVPRWLSFPGGNDSRRRQKNRDGRRPLRSCQLDLLEFGQVLSEGLGDALRRDGYELASCVEDEKLREWRRSLQGLQQ